MSRDALIRLQTSLEDRCRDAEPRQRKQLEKDLKQVRWALGWEEDYRAGPHAWVWQRWRSTLLFAIGAGVPLVWMVADDGLPLVTTIIRSAINLSLAVGIVVASEYNLWRIMAKGYRKALDRAEQLLLEQPAAPISLP